MLINLRRYRFIFFLLALILMFFFIGVAKTAFAWSNNPPEGCGAPNCALVWGTCYCYTPFSSCSDILVKAGDFSALPFIRTCPGYCTDNCQRYTSWPCSSQYYSCWWGTYVFRELIVTVIEGVTYNSTIFCKVREADEPCNIPVSGGGGCPAGKSKWDGTNCSCNPTEVAGCASLEHQYDHVTCQCLFGDNELRDACLESGGDWDSVNKQCTCRLSLISSLFVAYPACNCELQLFALHYNGVKEFLHNPPASLYKRTYENEQWVDTYLFDFPGIFSLLLLDPNNYYRIYYSGFTGIGCGANYSSFVSFEYGAACVVGGCAGQTGGGMSLQKAKKIIRLKNQGAGGYEQRN